MLVWLASYPRSGNHLLRTLLKRCFDLGSFEIYQKVAAPAGEPLSAAIGARAFDDASAETFVARARQTDELNLVKTHEPVPPGDRCIYVVRDARAALVSFQTYLAEVEHRQCSLAGLIEGKYWPGKWHEHVERFLSRDPARTLVLTYEELSSGQPPLDRISAFLGVPVRRPFDVSFTDLRSINPKIFRIGSNADAIETVEREHSDLFWRTCGATMRKLGYPGGPEPASGKGRKVFFLHLPKCAGTSLWGVLGSVVGNGQRFQVYDAERARQFAAMAPAERNSYRAIGGHFELARYRALLDLSQYYCVTTFREPVERLLSEYHYAKGNPKHSRYDEISKQSLREFIEDDPNPITRLICGKPDAAAAAAVVREVFDRWVFVDELPALIASVCGHLGRPIPPLPHMNIGPRSINDIAVDDEHRALIGKVHAADIAFHQILRSERYDRSMSLAPAGRSAPARPITRSADWPIFQIVTPTYNVARYLEETIESVVSQEGDFQVCYHIQDGGSKDRTLAIARDWQARIESSAFKVRCRGVRMTISCEPDRGMYDAIATGFRRLAPAAEDYATWINGDDKLAPGALATVADAFRDMPAVELVGGRTALIDARGEPLVFPDLPLYPRRSVVAGLHEGRQLPFVMQEGTFWRMGLWQRTGGVDASFRFAGDWDLWKRFAAETDYVTLDAVTAYHRRRPGQITENLRAYYREIDARMGSGAEEREWLLSEYQDAGRPNSRVPANSFPASVARRDEDGRWVVSEGHFPASQSRKLQPVDGDWVVVSGFDGLEGPFPDEGIKRPFHWAVERRAVLQIFSTRAGERTLWLSLGSMARNQAINVSVNGGRAVEKKLHRRYPKSERLDVRHHFDVGATTVEIDVGRWVTTPRGRQLGVMLYSAGFWRGGSQVSWFKRLLPKPLRAYV